LFKFLPYRMNHSTLDTIIPDWAKELPASITVTDKNANILFMNDKALLTFAKYGGTDLIGRSLFNCHAESSAAKIRGLLETGGTNVYTIEKQGTRKLIWQSAWFSNGVVSGLVEISLILPPEMPHYIRS